MWKTVKSIWKYVFFKRITSFSRAIRLKHERITDVALFKRYWAWFSHNYILFCKERRETLAHGPNRSQLLLNMSDFEQKGKEQKCDFPTLIKSSGLHCCTLYSEVHFWEELKLFVYLIAYSSFSFVKTFILFYVLHVRPFKWYISTFWPFILYIIHICQLISYLEVSNHGGVLASTFDCSFKKYPFVLKKLS